MALVDQNILITAQLIDQFSGTAKSIVRNTRAVETQMQGLHNMAAITGISVKKVSQFFKDNNLVMMNNQEIMNALTKQMLSFGTVANQVQRATRRFKFEWLSVMFVGMAINRVFSQYTKGALEWLGVTELFTESLKLAVFVALQPFHNSLINISTALFDASPELQAFVGWMLVLGSVTGGTLSVLGQFFLGLQGMKALLPGITKAFAGKGLFGAIGVIIKGIGVALMGTIGIVLLVVAIVIAAAVGIYLAWKTNFLNIQLVVKLMVDGFKKMFRGLFNFFRGIIKIFTSLFKGDFRGAIDGVKQMFKGMFNFVVGLLQGLYFAATTVALGLFKVFDIAIRKIWGIFKWVFDLIGSGFRKLLAWSDGGTSNGSSNSRINDFIWRPGQGAVPVNPSDTLVGFKGAPPNLGGGKGLTFNPVYNINVSDKREFENLIKDNNVKMLEDLRRLVKT